MVIDGFVILINYGTIMMHYFMGRYGGQAGGVAPGKVWLGGPLGYNVVKLRELTSAASIHEEGNGRYNRSPRI